MLNFPVSLRKPLLNSELESILNTDPNLVVCSISAIDLEDSPLIDSPTSKVLFPQHQLMIRIEIMHLLVFHQQSLWLLQIW